MNPKLVAKIKAPDTSGTSSIGTGYPISPEWVVTAAHVVIFDDRGIAPITVEWLPRESVEVLEVKSLGNDIALLRCTVPAVMVPDIPIFLPTNKLPAEQTGWKSAGYPELNDCGLYDAMGTFGVDLGESTISLTLADTCRRDEWGGMSGAPVFQGDKFCAVITVHDRRMRQRLYAVSVPWLLTNEPEFQRVVGCSEDSQHQQFFLNGILNDLMGIEGSPLFLALAKRFVGEGLQPTPETLSQTVGELVQHNPIHALEQLRLICEPVMKDNHASVQQVKKLLCLLLGLVAAAGGQVRCNGVHELAVRTRMMVEVLLATHYRVRPDLEPERSAGVSAKDTVVGRYALGGECLPEVGWNPQTNAKEIAKAVNVAVNKAHKQVYGDEPQNTLDEFELAELNETLLTRRKNEYPQLIRFEVTSSDELKKTHPLHDEEVCAALHGPECLPALPIVRYGLGTAVKEAQLRAQVNEFFRIIQQYS